MIYAFSHPWGSVREALLLSLLIVMNHQSPPERSIKQRSCQSPCSALLFSIWGSNFLVKDISLVRRAETTHPHQNRSKDSKATCKTSQNDTGLLSSDSVSSLVRQKKKLSNKSKQDQLQRRVSAKSSSVCVIIIQEVTDTGEIHQLDPGQLSLYEPRHK